MSESKHTPGPWMMATRPSSIVGWPVVAPYAMGRSVCNVTAGHDESAANARLIAAAPDLLAALKDARETIIQHVNSRGSEAEGSSADWVAEIDAAIARAEGL